MQPFPSGQVAGQDTRTTESRGNRKGPPGKQIEGPDEYQGKGAGVVIRAALP